MHSHTHVRHVKTARTMPRLHARFALASAALASTSALASAGVVVESSYRSTYAFITDYNVGIQTDHRESVALGPLTLRSTVGPTIHTIFADITLDSSSSELGMSGNVNLAQRGLDTAYMSPLIAWTQTDHVMTFTVDTPTPYRMEITTHSSTWNWPPLYGLSIARGVWISLEDPGISFLDSVAQPPAGTEAREGVLLPDQYTAFYRYTTANFGPGTFELTTASHSYNLAVPSPGPIALAAPGAWLAARRRR